MLWRDAHIISNMKELVCHTILKRECMCETMNPGQFLIIRSTFPTTFKHLLHSDIFKSENTKTLLLLAFTYKIPKNIIHHHYYHPCIFIYHHRIFIYCFASIIILTSFSHLVPSTTWWGWGHKAIYFVCRKSREGQGDKTHTTDSPRVRY